MTITEIKAYLRTVGGTKHDLASYSEFMNQYVDLEQINNVIHVLGTNGKGSTLNYLRCLLNAANYNVGTFTSPALIDVNDRIRINNMVISDKDFTTIFNLIYEDIVKYELGFFQILFAISLIYFKQHDLDYLLIEAGIGGLYDCTSIVKAQVRLITNISLDHTAILGNTHEEICLQKLGALRNGEVLFTTIDEQALLRLVDSYCKHKQVTYYVVDSSKFAYELQTKAIYQKNNASLALAVFRYLEEPLDEQAISKALYHCHWQGRFDIIDEHIIIDGAHNFVGVKQCVASADAYFGKDNYTIIMSVLKDKDLMLIYHYLQGINHQVIVTTFDFYRAYLPKDLAKLNLNSNSDYRSLVNRALNSSDNYLIVGSLYFIRDVICYLQELGVYNVD